MWNVIAATDPAAQVALIGFAGTIVTTVGVVLAARHRTSRAGATPDPITITLAKIAGRVGSLLARVDDLDERVDRLEAHERRRRAP